MIWLAPKVWTWVRRTIKIKIRAKVKVKAKEIKATETKAFQGFSTKRMRLTSPRLLETVWLVTQFMNLKSFKPLQVKSLEVFLLAMMKRF